MAKKKRTPKSKPPPEAATISPSEQLSLELARAFITKRLGGKTPTSREAAEYKRVERELEEQRRWAYYRSIPQKHWREMSGRRAQQLKEQAERYGLPFGGAKVDLPALVRALHDFLATNARSLLNGGGDVGELFEGASPDSPALERWRGVRADLAAMDLAQKRGELLPREQVRDGLGLIASVLRRAGETLQRECGRDAHDILEEALDEVEDLIRKELIDDDDET